MMNADISETRGRLTGLAAQVLVKLGTSLILLPPRFIKKNIMMKIIADRF